MKAGYQMMLNKGCQKGSTVVGYFLEVFEKIGNKDNNIYRSNKDAILFIEQFNEV